MDRISKNNLIQTYQQEFTNRYKCSEFITSIAPGRINIIGEHTDYNLGLAMPIAIDRWICVIVSKRDDNLLKIYSSNYKEEISTDIDNPQKADNHWKKYTLGCFGVIKKKYSIKVGLNIVIGGNVPIGFGVSSSAALEVSLLGALLSIYDLKLDLKEILLLSNQVEQKYLGIKSGMLDQYTSLYSKKDNPLLINFSTLSHRYVQSNIKNASWVLINSLVDRSLVDSKYNDRVMECEEGLRLINEKMNCSKKIYEIKREDLECIKDQKICYNRLYHVVTENERVLVMEKELQRGNLKGIGKLLNQSHKSLSNMYDVSCKEIESIISISKEINGFYGGRIMGGGFGGCTLNLVNTDNKKQFIEELIHNFTKKYQYSPEIEFINFANGFELI